MSTYGRHIVTYNTTTILHGIGIGNNQVVYEIIIEASHQVSRTQVQVGYIPSSNSGWQVALANYPANLTYDVNILHTIANRASQNIGMVRDNTFNTTGDNFAFWCVTNNEHPPYSTNIFGQHLSIKRIAGLYEHHGIGVENNLVIHYGDTSGGISKTNSVIHLITLEQFAHGNIGNVKINPYRNRYSPLQVRNRAINSMGKRGYSLTKSNCEHFARWCLTGEVKSKQIENIKTNISALALIALIGVVLEDD